MKQEKIKRNRHSIDETDEYSKLVSLVRKINV